MNKDGNYKNEDGETIDKHMDKGLIGKVLSHKRRNTGGIPNDKTNNVVTEFEGVKSDYEL